MIAHQEGRAFSVAGMSYFAALGALFFSIQPVILGAISETLQFDEPSLGLVSSFGLLSTVVGLGSAYFWTLWIDRRSAIAFGLLVATAASSAFVFVENFWSVSLTSVLLGFGSSFIYAPILIALAQAVNPTKSFAVAVTFMVLVAGAVIFLVPTTLVPRWGLGGLAGILCVVYGSGFLLLGHIPRGKAVAAVVTSNAGYQRLAWLGLLGGAVFFIGANASFAFFEVIGGSIGIDSEQVGIALASSLLLGALGSVAAGLMGDRVSIANAMVLGVLGMVAYVAAMLLIGGVLGFYIGVVVFNVAWNFMLPYQMAVVAQVDESGRYVALIPAAQMVGGAIGPAIAGGLLVSAGMSSLYVLLILTTVIASLLLVRTSYLGRLRQNPDG
ncbi:MAG: MFS transporter [Pseudomonadales bacterium]|nr:MFS transporter [Pseudomonadales bacterium]